MPKSNIIASATGWEDAKPGTRRRIIMGIEAEEKCGKTHFSFTGPGPIYYHSFEHGDEGVVEKFLGQGKKIKRASYVCSAPDATPQETLDAADPIWTQFRRNYFQGLREGRTTIIDTGKAPYELLRLARFGKLLDVPAMAYGPVNMEWAAIYSAAFESNSNLVVLHRLKDEWGQVKSKSSGKLTGEKTGRRVLDGNHGTHFDTQINLRAFKQDGEFAVEVINSRFNPDLDGMVLAGDMCNFATVAQMVFPDSKEEDWV